MVLVSRARGGAHAPHSPQEDALLLAQDVADLHQTFVDIAVLVDDQSKALAQVETQIESAHAHVQSGNEQLSEVRTNWMVAPSVV